MNEKKTIDVIPEITGERVVPLTHSDKDKQLIREANQRIKEDQIKQAEGERRSASFVALH